MLQIYLLHETWLNEGHTNESSGCRGGNVSSLLHLKITAWNTVLTKFQHSERFKSVRGKVMEGERQVTLCYVSLSLHLKPDQAYLESGERLCGNEQYIL